MIAPMTFRPAAAVGLAALLAGSASAAHIDLFTEGDELLFAAAPNSDSDTFTDPDGSSIPLGSNTRATAITYAAGMEDGAAFGAQLQSGGSGTFVLDNSAGSWATFDITYGTQGTLDLVGIPDSSDFYTSLRVTFAAIDYNNQGTPSQVPTLTVTATDTGGDTDSVALPLANGAPAPDDYFFQYNAFDPSVDFSSLDTLNLRIESNVPGADFTLEEVFRDGRIPEPTSLALLGFGGALMLRRR